MPLSTTVDEVAPDIYRIATYVPEVDFPFCQFLVKDDEPLLFHTASRSMFPLVRDAVARVLDPAQIRWISFSHYEADECGSLNDWLEVAPNAEPVCSLVGALVSVNDFANRGPRNGARRRARHGRAPVPLPPDPARPALLGGRNALR